MKRRTSADTHGDVQPVLGKLEATNQVLLVQQLLANSPNAFRPFMLLSDALLTRATLPREVVEVVILYMAAAREVGYEWAEHVPMASRAGVTDEQTAAIAAGRCGDDLFSADVLQVLDVTRGLLAGDGIAEDAWLQVVDRWGIEGALDLVFTVGWWGGFVPTCLTALGLTAEDVR